MEIPDFTDFNFVYESLTQINAEIHKAEKDGLSKEQYMHGPWVSKLPELYRFAAETVDAREWIDGFSIEFSAHYPSYVSLTFIYKGNSS